MERSLTRRPGRWILAAAAAAAAVVVAGLGMVLVAEPGRDDKNDVGLGDAPTPPVTLLGSDDEPVDLVCDDTIVPASALGGPGGAEQAADPAARALRGLLDDPTTPGGILVHEETRSAPPGSQWRRLADAGETVLFGFGPDGDGRETRAVTLERRGGEWSVASSGNCPHVALPDGVKPVYWSLDASHPLSPQDDVLHLLLEHHGCLSEQVLEQSIVGPEVQVSGEAVTIGIGVVEPERSAPEESISTCPMVETPVVVQLPEPLGGRQVFDGLAYPPEEPSSRQPS